MQGAPQVTNAWGVLVSMLDACLINGFNTQTATSVTRSGSTVTMTFSGGGHGFVQHQVILVSGAVESEYNGEHRVTAVTGTTVTFTITGTPSSPATGLITAKAAPLGFDKPFSGTDKAVYRSANLSSTRMFLRVDNSLDAGWGANYAKFAKVTIADAMSGVDTFTGSQAPFLAADPNRNHVLTGSGTGAFNGWAKWYYAKNGSDTSTPTAGNRKWVLIGDDKGFYLSIAWQPTPIENRALYAFGDFDSLNPSDAYNCLLQSRLSYHSASSTTDSTTYGNAELFTIGQANAVAIKAASGVGDMVHLGGRTLIPAAVNTFRSGDNWNQQGIVSPNATDSSNLFAPAYLFESATINATTPTSIRGKVRGAYFALNRKPYTDGEIISISGKSYMAVSYFYSGTNLYGLVLFDITGPWS